ncbi:hypothetical protein ASPZODRAFT_67628 [Penicilliopsis zonata CBS 506.65]|uniref:non-reducing end alpha-L-arabinofuranosidase n=1 Tax=Penicilliopsis zonata CBS 506.65 TaxID=1073090 RepID=A0A1L9SGD5_9EURO|nr:hypothetical protein ASPZODRAFT_67628 [Penicilliopsis zonata CBS 506.65]OJJ46231.1 hypothetical protein ASPZODRAFT_67628 [Penicilliopsis zonata CBS 506.65]
MILLKIFVVPFLAVCGYAVEITVASSGGNVTVMLGYGAMEEEINHAGDGGLYAELIRNRAFQGSDLYPSSLDAWEAVNGAELALQSLADPLSLALPYSMNVKGNSSVIGFKNSGYWGIDVQAQTYTGSFWARGSYNGSFTAALETSAGDTLISVEIDSESVSDAWVQHNFTLTPTSPASDTDNVFSITFNAAEADGGALDFNLISLFPPTYSDRPNGMRKDLMEALAVYGTKFLRFPGGNNLEGETVGDRWIWNNTIGPLTSRPGRASTWDYEETDGLGLVEYMEWCDDLGIEPILAVWSGLALDETVVSESEIDIYVQEALDELEFLTGSVDTEYGALRAQYGHPDPWTIRYVEVGNEDYLNGGLDSYISYRFSAFYDAITEKYPEISIIASTIEMTLPGNANGDYHMYDTPDAFVEAFNQWDQYSNEHHYLLGELAATEYNGADVSQMYPWWSGSVGEAVYLLGAERNADKIIGATYAPLMCNIDSYQWTPNFIAYDADTAATAPSTSYYVYQLFNQHIITNTLPANSSTGFGPLYYVAGLDNSTDERIFKAAVYNSTGDVPIGLTFEGVDEGTTAQLTVRTAPEATSANEVGGANVVSTNTTTLTAGSGGMFSFSLPNLSVAVLVTSSSTA